MSEAPNNRNEQEPTPATPSGSGVHESVTGGPVSGAPMIPLEQSPTRLPLEAFAQASPPPGESGPAPSVPEPVPEAPPMAQEISADDVQECVTGSGPAPSAGEAEQGIVAQPTDGAPTFAQPEPATPSEVSAETGATQPPGEAGATSSAAAPPPQIHAGKIVRVTAEEVFVVIDTGDQGYVPLIEFASQPLPHVGDDLSVLIERTDEKTGQLVLSKRQADEFTFWQSVQPGEILEGVITGMNKGGLDVDIGGARAFLPASQVDVRRMHDISVLIGEHVRCVVTQVDRATQDLVVSRRRLQEIEKHEQRKHAVEQIQEGEIRTGKVSNITEFGAFVNLGGVDALLHMSDMSWGRIRPPAEVVRKGQELTVKVLKVDRTNGKVSVGLKQAKPNPWDGIQERYPEGNRIPGKVMRFADFGAFLELEDGVEALLPISEMSWTKRVSHPSDVLKEGEQCEVVVLRVDPGKRRISVGLRQTVPNPWDSLEQQFPVNSTVKGRVTKIMDYGAFVEILPGVEGLVHISALSDRRVRAVGDVVKEGQEVDVRILKIDRESQRVSLSMKPEEAARRSLDLEGRDSHKGADKKKQRPARGGLSSHFDWMGEGLKRIKPPS